MGFLDVQSHPLALRRTQSREALEGFNRPNGVSTFQRHAHPNINIGGQHRQGGKQQVLPVMEVQTLGRPANKKRGQNAGNLSTGDPFNQQATQHAEV